MHPNNAIISQKQNSRALAVLEPRRSCMIISEAYYRGTEVVVIDLAISLLIIYNYGIFTPFQRSWTAPSLDAVYMVSRPSVRQAHTSSRNVSGTAARRYPNFVGMHACWQGKLACQIVTVFYGHLNLLFQNGWTWNVIYVTHLCISIRDVISSNVIEMVHNHKLFSSSKKGWTQ